MSAEFAFATTDFLTQLRTRLHRDYVYHPPFGDQVVRYAKIRDGMRNYLKDLLDDDCIVSNSRELQLALTHCEEAVFYLNAAIARNESPTADDLAPLVERAELEEANPANHLQPANPAVPQFHSDPSWARPGEHEHLREVVVDDTHEMALRPCGEYVARGSDEICMKCGFTERQHKPSAR